MVRTLVVIFKNYYKYCECGCGILTKILDKYGRIRIFINGHNSRLMKAEKSSNWKGGRFKNGNGYWLIYKPDHPFCDKKGYVLEHRLVMEEHIGRYLTRDEEIHHIEPVTLEYCNNDISNLQLLSKPEHMKITKLKNLDDRKCRICNNPSFIRRKTKLSGLRPIWYGNETNGWLCCSCHGKILRNRARTNTAGFTGMAPILQK